MLPFLTVTILGHLDDISFFGCIIFMSSWVIILYVNICHHFLISYSPFIIFLKLWHIVFFCTKIKCCLILPVVEELWLVVLLMLLLLWTLLLLPLFPLRLSLLLLLLVPPPMLLLLLLILLSLVAFSFFAYSSTGASFPVSFLLRLSWTVLG